MPMFMMPCSSFSSSNTRGVTAMEQEVASSVPRVPDHPESGVAAVHAVQQHTPAQVSRTPSRATPTALSAARELLRHPLAPRLHQGP
jgi:hypothetical protein